MPLELYKSKYKSNGIFIDTLLEKCPIKKCYLHKIEIMFSRFH